jgi:hypothetical protein
MRRPLLIWRWLSLTAACWRWNAVSHWSCIVRDEIRMVSGSP